MISHTWPAAFRAGVIRALLLAIPVALLTMGWAAARGAGGERLAIATVINVVLVASISIFVGNSGVESFGHVAFSAIGAYAVAILATPPEIKRTRIADAPLGLANVHFDVLPAALISLVFVAVVALLIGLVVMRMSGITSTIVTLALLVVVNGVINNWTSVTGGAEAFYGVPTVMTLPISLVAMALVLFAASVFKSSPWGLMLQASREDELASETMGVNVRLLRLIAFVISAIGAGAAGVLLALLLGAITPNDFYLTLTFITIAMLVLGGKRSTTGAVIGVVVVTVGEEIFRWLGDGPTIGGVQLPALPGFSTLFLGVIIVVVMIWRSAGIMGDREIDDFTKRWFRRTGDRPLALQDSPTRSTARLSAENLVKHFEGVTAVDGVSLEVGPGEIVGLIGPNGAGKTTLLNLLSGVLPADAGSVSINGQVLPRKLHRIARTGLARTFQNIRLFRELDVSENVQVTTIVARASHDEVMDPGDLLATFHLESQANRKAGVLAYGDQRRLEIARAAAIGSHFVLLDEPVAGMNEVESLELRETIRELNALRGAGVLVVDHDLSFILGLCQRIYVLDAGKIIAVGTPKEIANNPAVIEAYIGASAAKHQQTDADRSEAVEPNQDEDPS
jgi:branched-chain amino acid transport system permease protein